MQMDGFNPRMQSHLLTRASQRQDSKTSGSPPPAFPAALPVSRSASVRLPAPSFCDLTSPSPSCLSFLPPPPQCCPCALHSIPPRPRRAQASAGIISLALPLSQECFFPGPCLAQCHPPPNRGQLCLAAYQLFNSTPLSPAADPLLHLLVDPHSFIHMHSFLQQGWTESLLPATALHCPVVAE